MQATSRWRSLGAATALLVTACGSAATEPAAPTVPPARPLVEAVPGVLALQGSDGTVALGTEVVGVGRIVDGGSVAITATTTAGRTEVEWHATADGAVLASVTVDGDLELVAANDDGRSVALVNRGTDAGDHAIADGRASTEIVVVDRDGEQFRQRYDGNLVPEGFANWYAEKTPTLPGAAFVLEFTPPESPTHYRVRTLDLTTGELGLPLDLRDKSKTVDQLMAGVSRTQLLAARDGLLFTLYRGHHDEGHGSYAFVHTLGLGNGVWCLVVPDEMQLEDHGGALAMTPNGDDLVAVSANGTIAKIPVVNIVQPDRPPDFSAPVSLDATTDGVPAMATGRAHLWVGLGRTLIRVDPSTLVADARVDLPVTIEAIAERADGSLVVGGEGTIVVVSAAMAVGSDAATVDGVGPLHSIVTDRRSA